MGGLSSAVEVLQKLEIRTVPIIGLAKRLEEVYLPDLDEPIHCREFFGTAVIAAREGRSPSVRWSPFTELYVKKNNSDGT